MQALNEAQRADDYRIRRKEKYFALISLVTCNIASFELSFVEFRILQVSHDKPVNHCSSLRGVFQFDRANAESR